MSTNSMLDALRRGAVAAAIALLACGTAGRAAAAEPDACIAGQYVIGCQAERDLDDIGTYRGDSEALRKSIFDSIVSGKCKVFRDGEAVVVTDRTFVSERRLVRRADDANAYWMPAKWTRPIGECGQQVAAAKAADEPKPSTPAKPAPARQATPVPMRPAVAETASACEIKTVMTDEDIAACRKTLR